MQSQLARSSQNEEVILLDIGINIDTVINYDTDRMTQEAAIPIESSRANTPRGQASVFDRLGHIRDREGRAPFHLLKPAAHLFPRTDHVYSIPFRRKISMDNLSQESQMSSLLETCILA
ncbi:Hypothetical predicted protein [Olea europaea subsp. europaea]|uniref:Uncharacterized protein n=1 Tax=Olea europaea subsp. europaea TaxID=158383 RepID=A0A8S0RXV7_OLEEU|nr:Hypothetical predicted protein [Olea europaea subsp. europaea]